MRYAVLQLISAEIGRRDRQRQKNYIPRLGTHLSRPSIVPDASEYLLYNSGLVADVVVVVGHVVPVLGVQLV